MHLTCPQLKALDPPISMPTTNNRLLTKESLHFARAKSPIGSCTTGRLQFIQFSHRQTVAVSQSPRSDGLSRRLRIVRKADAFSFFSTTEQQRPYLCHTGATVHSCQRHIGSRILKFRSRFWQSRYLSNGHISIVATFGNLRSLSGVMVVGSFGQSGLTWAICLLGRTQDLCAI